MSSLTLVLSGNSSALRADYFPPIELDHRSDYECCLVDFHTYNTIPNVNENNNKIYVDFHSKFNLEPKDFNTDTEFKKHIDSLLKSKKKWTHASKQKLQWFYHLADFHQGMGGDMSLAYSTETVYELPIGTYEIEEIITALSYKLDSVHIEYDKNTSKASITIEDENVSIDFTKPDTLRNILGFGSVVLEPKKIHVGEYQINITTINAIRIECNLATGSFINEKSCHAIHEFYPDVGSGYKIVEVPKNLIYLPIVERTIRTLHFDIVDQDGNLVDFRGETITCRIHIRKVQT